MFQRSLLPTLVDRARRHPIVSVVGPRQSGKTTLCTLAFPEKPLVRLESLHDQEQARADPAAFLARFPSGAILDEVQRAPELFPELQVRVDTGARDGEWILTGSQHFGLLASISQSLAGRVSLLTLLPLTHDELGTSAPARLDEALFAGGYPKLHDRHLDPREWLADYVATYVERDVRQVLKVVDLSTFQTFLRLAAGRVGQVLNLSSLGADAGITHPTAREWVSVLEASFVAFRLQPWFRNVGKRLVKSPKLYFHDTGLLCHLLGIRTSEELELHYLRGAIFENWVISELVKANSNRGEVPMLHYYRDQSGREVDLMLDRPLDPVLVEIKSSQRSNPEFAAPMDELARLLERGPQRFRSLRKLVVFGGDAPLTIDDVEFVPWRTAGRVLGAA